MDETFYLNQKEFKTSQLSLSERKLLAKIIFCREKKNKLTEELATLKNAAIEGEDDLEQIFLNKLT